MIAKQASIEELRDRADVGEGVAAFTLVDLFAKQGRIDELEGEVAAGTLCAAEHLAMLTVSRGTVADISRATDPR